MINITIDLNQKTFLFEEVESEDFNLVNIYRKGNKDLELKKFGFALKIKQMPFEDEIVYEYTESEDSDTEDDLFFVGHLRFFGAEPNEYIVLDITAFNKRDPFQGSFEVLVPKPPKPYESWVWDDETHAWESSVPKPELVWNENTMSWHLP